VMEVDNLSHPDSIGITLRKNGNLPAEMLGVAIVSGGKLQNFCFAWVEDNEIGFKMDKSRLPLGVSQIVLFNSNGEILCDRLIFIKKNDHLLDITAKTGKPYYHPYELVEMEFSVTHMERNPANTTFSVSVKDGANEIASNHNILTDLLLMSEIKGYVSNPSYYFVETHCNASLRNLDVLLMVQGWRRYSWNLMAGVEPFELKYFAEQGIEINGSVVNVNIFGKQTPKPEIDVDLFLHKKMENDEMRIVETFVTDELGRFSFVADVDGRWNAVLSAKENGKAKNYMIIFDRLFSPEPKRYRYADLQIIVDEKVDEIMIDEETPDDDDGGDYASFFVAYQDSLAKLGIDEKTHFIEEITITAKKRSRTPNIYQSKSTSVAYYDVASEIDDLYDRGQYIGSNIHELLNNINPYFFIKRYRNLEWMAYKAKPALIVVNYERVAWHEFFHYTNTRVSAVKSVYINENPSVIAQYIKEPNAIRIALELSCVVFIETYPVGEIPVEGAKGVRKTRLEGYNRVSEFYSPNYSELPPAPDYRRTLYWNPMVTTDENGKAKIQFYNNSSCRNFSISAETVTSNGIIGIHKRE